MKTSDLSVEARAIRAQALRMARAAGFHYSARSKHHEFYPGQLEGEPFEVAYFYDQALNGDGEPFGHPEADEVDGDLLALSEAERQAFEVEPLQTHVAVYYSTQGFVSLEYLTDGETAALLAQYETGGES